VTDRKTLDVEYHSDPNAPGITVEIRMDWPSDASFTDVDAALVTASIQAFHRLTIMHPEIPAPADAG
jgi:hypothetical protein